jgi:hypothetical protein
MKCPSCGTEASGHFCFSCGNSLKTGACTSCGAPASSGSQFCTNCGRPLSLKGRSTAGQTPAAAEGQKAEGNSGLAWWVSGALFVVVILVLGYPVLSGDKAPAGMGGGTVSAPGMVGAGSGSGLVDLTTMPLEEQGMVLFDRVMRSASAGDTADVAFFLPKALIVHEQMNPKDADGIFHFVLLYLTGEDFEAALAKAREGLEAVPDHLLLLGASGEAALALGDTDAARGYYQHYVDVYEVELGLTRSGYEHHQPLFPVYMEEARAFLDRG